MQLAGHAGEDRLAVLAAADDAGARVCARALAGEGHEVALVLAPDGVRAVIVEPDLVDTAERVCRPRPEAAAVIRRRDIEDELAALGVRLVLVAVPRGSETERGECERRDDQNGKSQPTLHQVEITLSLFSPYPGVDDLRGSFLRTAS